MNPVGVHKVISVSAENDRSIPPEVRFRSGGLPERGGASKGALPRKSFGTLPIYVRCPVSFDRAVRRPITEWGPVSPSAKLKCAWQASVRCSARVCLPTSREPLRIEAPAALYRRGSGLASPRARRTRGFGHRRPKSSSRRARLRRMRPCCGNTRETARRASNQSQPLRNGRSAQRRQPRRRRASIHPSRASGSHQG